jgi:hypothetical protein
MPYSATQIAYMFCKPGPLDPREKGFVASAFRPTPQKIAPMTWHECVSFRGGKTGATNPILAAPHPRRRAPQAPAGSGWRAAPRRMPATAPRQIDAQTDTPSLMTEQHGGSRCRARWPRRRERRMPALASVCLQRRASRQRTRAGKP